jgi:hypothetical protein
MLLRVGRDPVRVSSKNQIHILIFSDIRETLFLIEDIFKLAALYAREAS